MIRPSFLGSVLLDEVAGALDGAVTKPVRTRHQLLEHRLPTTRGGIAIGVGRQEGPLPVPQCLCRGAPGTRPASLGVRGMSAVICRRPRGEAGIGEGRVVGGQGGVADRSGGGADEHAGHEGGGVGAELHVVEECLLHDHLPRGEGVVGPRQAARQPRVARVQDGVGGDHGGEASGAAPPERRGRWGRPSPGRRASPHADRGRRRRRSSSRRDAGRCTCCGRRACRSARSRCCRARSPAGPAR